MTYVKNVDFSCCRGPGSFQRNPRNLFSEYTI